ncbi:MAG: DNA translocase FtsK 4TM domain-containing protein [Anaerotignaceae bacterium]
MADNKKATRKTTSSGKKTTGARKSTTAKKNTGAKKTTSKAKVPQKKFGDSIYDEIFLLVLIIVSILVLLSLFTSVMGMFGTAINSLLKGIFGAGAFILPVLLIAFCVWMLASKEKDFARVKVWGIILFVLSIATFFQLINTGAYNISGDLSFLKQAGYFYKNATGTNGGVMGGVIGSGLNKAIGWGSYIVTVAAIIISVMLGTGKSLIVGISSFINYTEERRNVKEAKIKAQAENIRERELKREQKIEENNIRQIQRMEKKAKKGNFNINLGWHDEVEIPEQNKNEEVAEKVVQPLVEAQEEKKPIDISGIDLTNPNSQRLIEVLGVTKVNDDDVIQVFGVQDETTTKETTADVHMDIPIIETVEEPQLQVEEPQIVAESELQMVTKEPKIVAEDTSRVIEPLVEEFVETPVKDPVTPATLVTPVTPKAEPVEIGTVEKAEEPEYVFPPMDILGQKPQTASGETKTDMIANAKKLEETLSSFGVEAKVMQINKGPTVTRYELAPSQGVKVSKIVNLADDIALNLAATGIRIEAPIPGKAAVGIEVPNKETQSVYLRSVLESDAFKKFPSKLAFALGEDIAGNAIVTDIGKMPHLLIAGATGSGKSVCINTLITSILYKADPKEVKLLLVDPKVVELSVYNGIPHLLIPVVTDPKKAAGALNWAVREMLGRYQNFAEHNVRDIKGYNQMKLDKGEADVMPQIVIVIDELADLMMAAPGEVEDSICRLAQMARAAGMHLIIATQRPSVDVITGVIKANIPSRLAFAVSSGIDSRTILDSVGAEKLLGKGDMLFYPVGMSKPVRIQGAFVTDKEVENIVDFVKQGKNTTYDKAMIDNITSSNKSAEAGEDSDEFFDQAIDLVVEKEKASVSMLQRQFRIGYNRAARLMDDLESKGIVGSEEGSKPRRVLITQSQLNEMRYPSDDDM